jgi:hypothetical protein
MDKAKISVKEAIEKGKRFVNLPIPFIMMGVMILGFCTNIFKTSPVWFAPLSILGGILLGWLYWSFAITKWRIWAFSNVKYICVLEREAIKNQLIWSRGSVFEKTEIRTKKEKILIAGFQKELEKCDEKYRKSKKYE